MKSVMTMLALLAALALLAGCQAWNEMRDDIKYRNAPVEPEAAGFDELKAKSAQVQADDSASQTMATEAKTPRAAYEMFCRAIKGRDYEKCWTLMSSATKEACELEAAELKMRVMNSPQPLDRDILLLRSLGMAKSDFGKLDGKQAFIGSLKRAEMTDPVSYEAITRTRYDHEIIWGDHARLYVSVDGKTRPEPMKLVREGGLWHIDNQHPTDVR